MHIDTDGDPILVMISGDFDATADQKARPHLERLVAATEADVTVDLSDCRFIDTNGIGTLVFMFRRLVEKGGHLKLAGLSGQPKNLIEFLSIDRAIPVVESGPQMIRNYGTPPPARRPAPFQVQA